MATEFGLRLQTARKHAGMTQMQAAKATGIAQSTISTAEREGNSSTETVLYAKVYGVNATWLATGDGPMLPTGLIHQDLPPIHVPEPIELENNPDYPAVRRVSIKAQAGITGYSIEPMDDGPPIVFRADWYKNKGYRPERLLALRVSGESMVPTLYDSDLIVANTEANMPKDGLLYLVIYEGEVAVKRLIRDDGAWWLSSDNVDQRRYPRKLCNGATEIIGQVVYRQTEHL